MMTQAFYTGLSGLKTSNTAIDIVADNIANISTIGYRGYGTEFSALFEKSLSTQTSLSSVDSTLGLGVTVQASSMDTSYGTLSLADQSTDLALYGDGWFGIQGNDKTMYTRAGNFSFDANSDLVTQDGFYVLGTMGNNISDGDVLTSVMDEVPLGNVSTQEKLRFPKSLTYPAEPTTSAKFLANIGVEDEVRTVGAGVIDADGNQNHLRLEFTKSAVQTHPGTQWDVVATTQTLDGTVIYDTKNGVVSFDEQGGLVSSTLDTIDNNGSIVTMDLGSGYDGIVSTFTPATSGSSITDGTIGGELVGYSINKNAEVIATFSNGLQSSVGKVAVYHFQNDQGLLREAGARFSESDNSGEPIFFQDEDGNNILGTDITNFQLENSNVKLDVALTELIILQRTYDSNSRSITTADEMMKKALEMDA
jgi:flagellar hook protein FlgE